MFEIDKTKFIYVACPYWHNSEKIRQERRKAANDYSYFLTVRGFLNYSPLSYTEKYEGKKMMEGYWIEHGLRMVDACNEMHVLTLHGWRDSSGLSGEIAKAKKLRHKILYVRKSHRLGFCGSRSLEKYERITRAAIRDALFVHQPDVVVTHGEPRGVCTLARLVAKNRKFGLPVRLYHLDHRTGTAMYKLRTKAVLADCDFCVFLHDGVSDGTMNELYDCIDAGIPFSYHVFENGEFVDRTDEVDVSGGGETNTDDPFDLAGSDFEIDI